MILARLMGAEELSKFKKGEIVRPLSAEEFKKRYPYVPYAYERDFCRDAKFFMDWSSLKLAKQSREIYETVSFERLYGRYGDEKVYLVVFRSKKHFSGHWLRYGFETFSYGDPETGWQEEYCYEVSLKAYSKADLTIAGVYRVTKKNRFSVYTKAAREIAGYKNLHRDKGLTYTYNWEWGVPECHPSLRYMQKKD